VNALVFIAPFAAIFVSTASVVAMAHALLSRFVHSRRVSPSTSVHALAVFAPWLVAAIAALALASPDPFAACHCTQHGLHHPHLCLSHPLFASPLVEPSLVLLGVWLLVVSPRVIRLVREVITSTLWTRTIRSLPSQQQDGVSFRLHDCGKPSAFTVGVASPMIVFDKNLWSRLTIEERRAVLHHEQAHVERRDGLTLLVLRLCVALLPIPFSARLLDAWKRAAEKACDRHAAAKVGDTATVAAALVSVENSLGSSANPLRVTPALGIISGAELEDRVVALLSASSKDLETSQLGNDVLANFLVALGVAALTLVWPGDTLHHAAETLLGLIIH